MFVCQGCHQKCSDEQRMKSQEEVAICVDCVVDQIMKCVEADLEPITARYGAHE